METSMGTRWNIALELTGYCYRKAQILIISDLSSQVRVIENRAIANKEKYSLEA